MNLLMVVSVHDKPYGGHYHSSFAYFEALSKSYNVTLLVIGNEKPDWLSNYKSHYVYFNGLNIFSVILKCRKIISEFDILHAFDEFAYFFIRSHSNKKVVYTRCGGPNPVNRYYPEVNNLVCFSMENYTFFKASKKVSSVELIPNRVPKFSCDQRLCNLAIQEKALDINQVRVLRIARIDRYYEKSIIQTINLGGFLKASGIQNQVIIIGKVYDEDFYDELEVKYPQIKIISENQFTNNAKLLLDIANVVVGTGRSFMEAATLGKVVFSPLENSELPRLITSANIEEHFKANFSERVSLMEKEVLDLENITALLKAPEILRQYKSWIEMYATKNFLLDNCPPELKRLYEKKDKIKWSFDYIRQLIRVSSVFIRFSYRKYRESTSYN